MAIYNDWRSPWQFIFFIRNQRLNFERHSLNDDNPWYFVESSTVVALDTWTHVAVTWNHVKGSSLLYIDGKKKGYRTYLPRRTSFYKPSGRPYKIGNDDHWDDHQFYGSVMDIYVFGTELSVSEINKLRGWCVIRPYKHQ